MKPYAHIIMIVIALLITGCGMVGFEQKLVSGSVNHKETMTILDIQDIDATYTDAAGLSQAGEVVVVVHNKERAKLASKASLTTKQEDVTAMANVKVTAAVSKYLAHFLSGGTTLAVEETSVLLKAAATKAAAGARLTDSEELALAITPNDLNGNTQPPAAVVKREVASFVEEHKGSISGNAAELLLKDLNKPTTDKAETKPEVKPEVAE
jgi:hypothetical protein